MAEGVGEVRPLSEWIGRLRTVCHECRGTGHLSVPDDAESARTRSMIVPGEGEITRAVGTAVGDDSYVTITCPTCGDTEIDEPGWLDGFVIPV